MKKQNIPSKYCKCKKRNFQWTKESVSELFMILHIVFMIVIIELIFILIFIQL